MMIKNVQIAVNLGKRRVSTSRKSRCYNLIRQELIYVTFSYFYYLLNKSELNSLQDSL